MQAICKAHLTGLQKQQKSRIKIKFESLNPSPHDSENSDDDLDHKKGKRKSGLDGLSAMGVGMLSASYLHQQKVENNRYFYNVI